MIAALTIFIHPGRWELLATWGGGSYTWLCVTLRITRRRYQSRSIERVA